MNDELSQTKYAVTENRGKLKKRTEIEIELYIEIIKI